MGKVLIIQAARFGDLLQTKRLILSLSKSYETHLAVDQTLASLAHLIFPDSIIHEVVFHGNIDSNGFEKNRKIFSFFSQTDYKQIFNCNFSHLTSAICRLFDPNIIIGYRPMHNSNGDICRSPWFRLIFELNRIRFASTLNLVDYWGLMTPDPIPPQKVNPIAKPSGGGIGIALSGRNLRRSLPMHILAKIIQVLINTHNTRQIFLLGTSAESKLARQLKREFNHSILDRIVDLSGKTDWQALIEIISSLDLLVTPDTGIMHLSAHLGTPIMAFFLSSACCHETGPYGEGHFIWQAVTRCSPCLEESPCTQMTACLEPFKQNQFLRNLNMICNKRIDDLALSDDLQLWQTGFDQIGALPKLVSGKDHNDENRVFARNLIKNHLFPSSYSFAPITNNINEILKNIPPDTDWMLPAWRYY